MSIIKGINEFGNLVPVDTNDITNVNKKNGIYSIQGGRGGQLLFLHKVNRPAVLEGMIKHEPYIRMPKTIQDKTEKKRNRFMSGRVKKGKYLKVFEARKS